MAGIVGIAKGKELPLIEKALAKIEHRGSAGKILRSSDTATLGQVWPQAQESFLIGTDKHDMVLDGEIHNWTRLGMGETSPIEALGMAYHSFGPDFVLRLDGPFALGIAGPEGIFLARDVVGKSPLYYGKYQGNLCFASELKALLGWAEEIAEFPAGHYLEPGGGLKEFARIKSSAPIALTDKDIAIQLRMLLVESVRKRSSHGEIGAWLSGGLDSATMAALAVRQVPHLHTFSVGLQQSQDLHYARLTAGYLGAEHHEKVCTIDEMLEVLPEVIYCLESFDALLVRSSIMNYLVGALSADYVPAVLSGEGGDELFAGYAYLKNLKQEDLPEELVDITRRLHNTALQRVDRCSAGHGIVARTAFLDRAVVDYALRIPMDMKLRNNGAFVEKWILRKAMEQLLPEEILWRPKSKFWEGAGVGNLLAEHANGIISDDEFCKARELPDGSALISKEELLYYRIFVEQFGADLSPSLVGRTKSAPDGL